MIATDFLDLRQLSSLSVDKCSFRVFVVKEMLEPIRTMNAGAGTCVDVHSPTKHRMGTTILIKKETWTKNYFAVNVGGWLGLISLIRTSAIN